MSDILLAKIVYWRKTLWTANIYLAVHENLGILPKLGK